METLKKKRIFSGLRQVFSRYVLTAFALVAALSGLVIWGCLSLQHWLLPDSNQVYLTVQTTYSDGSETTQTEQLALDDVLQEIPLLQNATIVGTETVQTAEDDIIHLFISSALEENRKYAITSIENSFSALSPRRQLVYRGSQVCMIALPALFSIAGILLCGLAFYRRKLKTPIALLSRAADEISNQNLDFHVSYNSGDELGKLCASFEQMRLTLAENNQRLWSMLEERKRLQASVAHDLRNPIAIIQGYAEYLQLNLPKDSFEKEHASHVADNIHQTARRLERYTDSLRTINRLEELDIHPQPTDFPALSAKLQRDLALLTDPQGLSLIWEDTVSRQKPRLDTKILYRILENLVGNAARFAAEQITVRLSCDDKLLTVTVSDDGPGFPKRILNAQEGYAFADADGEHTGIGLAICQVLCRKHGGTLTLSNGGHGGGVASFTLGRL